MRTTPSNKWDIKINWNSVEITHPKNITELFNSYFSRIPENLLKKHGVEGQTLKVIISK
jgi:predicted metalloenzyme YecM